MVLCAHQCRCGQCYGSISTCRVDMCTLWRWILIKKSSYRECAVQIQKLHTVCMCVCVFVALGILHALLLAPYFLWLAPLYHSFPTFSHGRQDFRGKKNIVEHKMCVLTSSTTFAWNISHSEKNSAKYTTINVHWSSCKVPVVFDRF